jgi:hypothetical protein
MALGRAGRRHRTPGILWSLLRARYDRRWIEDELVDNKVKSFVTMVTND